VRWIGMDGWMDETDGNGSGDVQDPSDLGLGLGDAKGRAVSYVAPNSFHVDTREQCIVPAYHVLSHASSNQSSFSQHLTSPSVAAGRA
jgi:hypothetical protein